MKQIAQELGVSRTLVSKVLSGNMGTTGVKEETRAAILKRVEELDFQPNRLAVALKAGRTGVVGIFIHGGGTPGSAVTSRLLEGIAAGLEDSGVRMWLRFFNKRADFLKALHSRLENELDGLIVAGIEHPEVLSVMKKFNPREIKVVSVFANSHQRSAVPRITNVCVDHELQGYLPTRHLLEQGLRRVACLGGVPARYQGYLRAHKELGLRPRKELLVEAASLQLDGGRDAVKALLAAGHAFDGVVCHSDAQGVGAVNELLRQGIKVPDQVRVTGVDNSPLAASCLVPLTSVSSEMREAGETAATLLLRKIEGEEVESVVISPRLVLGESG